MRRYMKKFIFIVLFGCLFSTHIQSQVNVGLTAGFNVNEVITDEYVRSLLANQYHSAFSIQYAMPIHYNVWKHQATSLKCDVVAELSYTGKDYFVRSDDKIGSFIKIENRFIELPVMGQLEYGWDVFSIFVNGGLYGGYWVASKCKFSEDSWGIARMFEPCYYAEEEVEFNSERDNRFNYGLCAGVGCSWKLGSNLSLLTEVRIEYELSDLQKDYMQQQLHRYNNTYIARVGLLYRICE